MKKEVMEKWVTALRSGQYKQGSFALMNSKDNTYCCLGVLCNISGLASFEARGDDEGFTDEKLYYNESNEVLPESVQKWAEIRTQTGEFVSSKKFLLDRGLIDLAGLNDSGRFNFNEIADVIEENWEKL